MKKAKLLALLVCFGLSLSTFATACDYLDGLLGVESSSESVASEQQPGSEQTESVPETESEVETESVPETESDVETESVPESEEDSEEPPAPTVYCVEFRVDGEYFDACYYTEDELSILAPEVPAKDGYTGRWEAYELNLTDIVVNAVYEAIPYTIRTRHWRYMRDVNRRRGYRRDASNKEGGV